MDLDFGPVPNSDSPGYRKNSIKALLNEHSIEVEIKLDLNKTFSFKSPEIQPEYVENALQINFEEEKIVFAFLVSNYDPLSLMSRFNYLQKNNVSFEEASSFKLPTDHIWNELITISFYYWSIKEIVFRNTDELRGEVLFNFGEVDIPYYEFKELPQLYFCKYCWKELSVDKEKNQGFHDTCHDRIKQNESNFKSQFELLDNEDKELINKLGTFKEKNADLETGTIILNSGKGSNRNFTLQFHTKIIDSKLKIESFTLVYEDVIKATIKLDISKNLVYHDFLDIENNDYNFKHYKFKNSPFHLFRRIFNELVWRKLRSKLIESDQHYLASIIKSTLLEFYAFTNNSIVLGNSLKLHDIIRVECNEDNGKLEMANFTVFIIQNDTTYYLAEFLNLQKKYMKSLTLVFENFGPNSVQPWLKNCKIFLGLIIYK